MTWRGAGPSPMDVAELRRDMKKEGALCQRGLCGRRSVATVDGHALCDDHRKEYRSADEFTSLTDVLRAVRDGGDR